MGRLGSKNKSEGKTELNMAQYFQLLLPEIGIRISSKIRERLLCVKGFQIHWRLLGKENLLSEDRYIFHHSLNCNLIVKQCFLTQSK